MKAGRVITSAGEDIERGEIVIVDGEVSLVGVGLEYPKNAEVIEARDQVVMPGLIDAHSRFGLRGLRRNGVNGDATTDDEVYLNQIDFEPMLRHGFTLAGYYPDGNGITGTATVYQTAGDPDEQLVKRGAYLLIDFTSQPGARNTLSGALRKAKSELDKVEKAREEWEKKKKKEAEEKAKREAEEAEKKKEQESGGEKKGAADEREEKPAGGEGEKEDEVGEFEPPPIDKSVRPLADLIKGDGSTPALIEVRRASDLLHLDQVLEPYDEFAHRFLVLATGFTDLNHVAELFGEREAFIAMVPAMSTFPQTTTYFNAPAELSRAGCTIAFVPQFDGESAYEQFRTGAAELVRAGLGRADAIGALSARPAELLGVGNKFGTIETGKQADLAFFDADPLAPGARVTRVMIAGQTVWEREDESR